MSSNPATTVALPPTDHDAPSTTVDTDTENKQTAVTTTAAKTVAAAAAAAATTVSTSTPATGSAGQPSAVTASATVAAMPKPAPVPMPAARVASSGQSYLQERDEGVLRDVLEELDRERSKRAELEARIRQLEEEKRQTDMQHSAVPAANAPPRSVEKTPEYIALRTECAGYLQILSALTADRPAFAAAVAHHEQAAAGDQAPTALQMALPAFGLQAAKPSQHQAVKTLPLHVIRLLEILPWDERTQPYLFAQECVYEWQVLSSTKTWNKTLRQFPTFFKTLPIVVPTPGKTLEEEAGESTGVGKKLNTGSWQRPPKQGVLTTVAVDQILNIDKGFPLPEDGGSWQWIGGWRIEKRSNVTDNEGWSYSYNPNISADADNEHYHDRLVMPPKGQPNLIHRRRRWTRTRILIDYPYASEPTRQYLKILAEKTATRIGSEKLSDQLVQTKTRLTALEQEHMNLKEASERRVKDLTKDLETTQQTLRKKEELLMSYQKGDNGNVMKTKAKEQVKEFGSVMTQWMTDTVTSTRKRAMSASSLPQQQPQSNSDSAHDGNTVGSEEDRPESEDGTGAHASSSPIGTNSKTNEDTATSVVADAGTTTTTGGGGGGSSDGNANSASRQQLIDWDKMRGRGRLFDKFKSSTKVMAASGDGAAIATSASAPSSSATDGASKPRGVGLSSWLK